MEQRDVMRLTTPKVVSGELEFCAEQHAEECFPEDGLA